jgi:hypothetical protein
MKRSKKPTARGACQGKRAHPTKTAALDALFSLGRGVGANIRGMHAYVCRHGCRVDWNDGTNRPAWHVGHHVGRGGGIARGRLL